MGRVITLLLGSVLALLMAFGISWLIYMPDGRERGVWRLETGGSVLQLTRLKATLYSETRHSCLSDLTFPAHMKLIALLEGARIDVDGDTLDLIVDGALETRRFTRIDGLPDACTAPDPASATPQDIYDAVWTAMDEHYAFFDLHGVDWKARQNQGPGPGVSMNSDQLVEMLLELLDGIDDGHVHFGSTTTGWASPSERPAWIPAGNSLSREILRDIAISNAGTALTQAPGAPILYGLRSDGIGYIMIREMDVDVPIGGNSTQAMGDAFAKILADLSDATVLIIDIRYNPGGSDTVSFGIAGQFINSPLPVFTKTTRVGDAQSDPFTAVLQPYDDSPDMRPVVLMTSELTGSAAEILTLAMRGIPQVTTLGAPTGGGLSDVMGFRLPNGWGLGLSNQTYLTIDGALFEAIGIPPDQRVPFETPQFLAGRDPVLQTAIAAAQDLID